MNNRIKSMRCIKCDTRLPIGDYLFGCPQCYKKGENANATFVYEGDAAFLADKKGLRRYAQFLPYDTFPSLGEGNTPVVSLARLADRLGLKSLYTKNEFQNPTGSHKDRMNPFIIERAKELECTVVCCASSGNEAASLAAYAAAGGLRCVNAVAKEITPQWKSASLATGAQLVVTETVAQRHQYLNDKIDLENWYCATNQATVPVGSSCYGIQGYKTIAFELFEEFNGQLPEYILVPTTRGDLLYGIYEGFADLVKNHMLSASPHLVAVEPFPRLERVMAGESYTAVFSGDSALTPSIGGNTVTYQAQIALTETDGFAVSVPQETAIQNIKEMGSYGLYLEASAALALGALKKSMQQQQVPEGARVLLIATSHGYKNNPAWQTY